MTSVVDAGTERDLMLFSRSTFCSVCTFFRIRCTSKPLHKHTSTRRTRGSASDALRSHLHRACPFREGDVGAARRYLLGRKGCFCLCFSCFGRHKSLRRVLFPRSLASILFPISTISSGCLFRRCFTAPSTTRKLPRPGSIKAEFQPGDHSLLISSTGRALASS